MFKNVPTFTANMKFLKNNSGFSHFTGKQISVRKRKELGQYPAILTSHLVNNPDIISDIQFGVDYVRGAEIEGMLDEQGKVIEEGMM